MKVTESHIRGEKFSTKTANDKFTVNYGMLNGPELVLEDGSIVLLPDFTVQLDKDYYNAGTKEFKLENLNLVDEDDTVNETYYKNEEIDHIEIYQVGIFKKHVYRLIKF